MVEHVFKGAGIRPLLVIDLGITEDGRAHYT